METPPSGPSPHRQPGRLSRLLRPVSPWLRLGRQAVAYARHAGLWAALGRAAATLRQMVPAGARAAWLRLRPQGDPYRDWIRRTEPGPAALAAQRRDQSRLPHRPLISVVTPVYNPSPAVLRDTIASVLAQTYDRWELCLVDGASDVPGVAATLAGAAAGDPRIRVKTLPRNLGISANTNAGLAMASGEFVLVLDHDDLLAPDLLYAVVRRLNDDPALDVLYYDEDKISANGRTRRAPWFKPRQWSPALMLSTNVLMHAVVRRQRLIDLGGFDSAMDGAQDWDLALRLLAHTQRLAHLPQVGYHWRQVPGSAARDANAKPWAYAAQQRALEAHLARQGTPGARVSFPALGLVRVHWPVSGARASIIIPTRDNLVLLRACLTSLFALTTYPDYEIILVDTGSRAPETWAYYAALEAAGRPVRCIKFSGEFNYSAANNLGAAHATGEHLVFLNNDIEVLEPAWLEELIGWAEQSGVGLVGGKLIRPDDTIQHAGLVMGLAGHGSHAFDGSLEGTYGPFGSSEWYRDYLAVTGACLAVRRTVFEQLGGFDQAYQIGYSDIELGLRAVAHGLRVIYNPFVRLRHHEGGSRGFFLPPPDVLRAYWQMLPLVRQGDPYFSPHLSRAERRPAVARPHEMAPEARLEAILGDFDLLYRPLPLSQPAWADPGGPPERFPAADPAPDPSEPARRILLVSHDLTLSGAPQILGQAGTVLLQAGYAVTLLAPVDGPLRPRLTEAGLDVVVVPNVLHDTRALAPYLVGRGLVIANTILTWRAVLAARAAQVPCLYWIHESAFGQALARQEAGLRRALGMAERVIFASAAHAGQYAAWVPPERTAVISNGLALDATLHLEAAPVPDAPPGTLTVVNLASLEPRKGQAVLLQSVADLPPSLRDRTRAVLLGQPLDRRYHRRLQRLAGKLGLGRVTMPGVRPRAEALAYLRQADIFVLPSRDEVQPVTLLEAMSLGKAIIATGVGGIPEVVQAGQAALLVPPDDPAALSAALARLLQDAALRQTLGAAARARFESAYTRDHAGTVLLSLVESLIAVRQSRDLSSPLGAREPLGQPPVAYRLAPPSTSSATPRPLLETVPSILSPT